MTLHTAILAILIVMFGVAQYALCVQALRDLARRPRVRGDNKALWGLGILCFPIAGAILYNWMGPTSFIHRRAPTRDFTSEPRDEPAFLHPSPPNVTPISAAPSARRRRASKSGAGGGSPSSPGRARAGRTGT